MGSSRPPQGGQGFHIVNDFLRVELAPGQVVESSDAGLVELDPRS